MDDKTELEKQKLLADIEKAKKEAEKLDRDLATYDERLAIERMRVRNDRSRFLWETVRLLGVAVITGLIGYYSTSTVKKVELAEQNTRADKDRFYDEWKEIKALKIELERCEKSCDLYNSFLDKKIPGLENDLEVVHKICLRRDTVAAIAMRRDSVEKKVENIAVSNDVKKKFDSVEKQVNNLEQLVVSNNATKEQKQELGILKDSFDRLINSSGYKDIANQTQQVSTDYKKINDENKLLVNKIAKNSEKMLNGYPKTGWFKEGYFLVFDGIKIYLDDLNTRQESLEIDVCDDVSAVPCENLGKNRFLNKDQFYEFRDKNNFKYIVRLDRVGSAGKNPFSKAAYITVEKYAQE